MVTGPIDRDVIVVGAGPGGSAAAHALASSGWRVLLLEKAAMPRDKSCGDGLTRRSIEILDDMGAAGALLGQQRIDGVHLVLRRQRRAARYGDLGAGRPDQGAVVPRRVLDRYLCRHAVSAGAELWEHAAVERAIVEQGGVRGVEIAVGGRRHRLRSRFVVAADGANSRLARQLAAGARDEYARGFAIRQYFENVIGLDDYFEFRVPLGAPGEERVVAGYGWVFPLPGNKANIGVGYFPAQRCDLELNVRRLFERFLADLRREAPFREMSPAGDARGAPLSCHADFGRCFAPGILFVGDAAGLVDPFTGEGIDTALESGRLAAQVLDAALRRPADQPPDLARYGRLLEARYDHRFRVGKRFIRHHGFMWKLLVHTDEATGPLYESLRSAVVDFGTSDRPAIDSLPGAAAARARSPAMLDDVCEAETHLLRLVSDQFPLLSKAITNLVDPAGRLLRPALVLAAAMLGRSARGDRIEAASCLQLAHLGFVVHTDVIEPADRDPSRRPLVEPARLKWCNTFAVMAGDYLGVRAHELAARLGPAVTRLLCAQTATIAALRLRDLHRRQHGGHDLDSYLGLVVPQYTTFYTTAVELGAALVELEPSAELEALRGVATNLGTAVRLHLDAPGAGAAGGSGSPSPCGQAVTSRLVRTHLRAARNHAAAVATGELRDLLLALTQVIDEAPPADRDVHPRSVEVAHPP